MERDVLRQCSGSGVCSRDDFAPTCKHLADSCRFGFCDRAGHWDVLCQAAFPADWLNGHYSLTRGFLCLATAGTMAAMALAPVARRCDVRPPIRRCAGLDESPFLHVAAYHPVWCGGSHRVLWATGGGHDFFA